MTMQTHTQLERARLLIEQGRTSDAEKVLRQLLSQQPDSAAAWGLMGRVYLDTHRNRDALGFIEKALQLSPDEDYFHYLNAFALYKLSAYPQAIKWISQALALNPYEAGYHGLFGLIQMEQRNFTDALDRAEEGLSIDPENVTCLNLRAQALLKLGRSREAIEALGNTLAADPENDYSHTNAGYGFLEKGKHEEAGNHFREALRINPANVPAREGLKEALKSKIAPYRWLLMYDYWLNNKARGVRIALILGIYFGIRFMAAIAETLPKPLAVIIFVVFGLYILLVLVSWLIRPLGNLFLSLHPEGKYAITPSEKTNSYTVFFALLTGVLLLIVSLTFPLQEKTAGHLFMMALVAGSMAIPFSMLRYPLKTFVKSAKQWAGMTGAAIGLAALVCLAVPALQATGIGLMILYGIIVAAGTWIAAFSKD